MPRRARQAPQADLDVDANLNQDDNSEVTQRVVRRSTRIRRSVTTTAPYNLESGRTMQRRQIRRLSYIKRTVVMQEPLAQNVDQAPAIEVKLLRARPRWFKVLNDRCCATNLSNSYLGRGSEISRRRKFFEAAANRSLVRRVNLAAR